MKNKLTYSFIVVFTIFGLSGCTDDFVERTPVYSIDSENYFNSESDYYNALIGAYDLLQSTYLNTILGEIASDNTLAGGESATDVIGWQQVDDMIHTPVNSEIKRIWDFMYAGVNRANYILEFQDKTDFEGKAIIIAEARFLRAYYYFELVKWFGPVPLKETRFTLGDETSIPRSPVEDVYALIEADLTFASNTLSYTAPQIGRATKGSAQALLGKAFLYQDKFTEAANVFETLINNGPYDLVSDYNTLFESQGENGIESVFEVQYTDVEGASFLCLQCSEGNVAVGFSGVRNYSGPIFTSGFSFNVPTQEVVDAFEAGDIRKDVAILDIEAWAAETGATFGTGYEHTGYFNRKYLPRKRSADAAGDLNLTNPNNYRAIRFADVLLMAAEAYARGGLNEDKARLYLNRVRTRANLSDVTASGNALIDAIYAERRTELVGEGHRFFDLVRTNRGSEIDGFSANRHELFPIPFEEIQFSNGNWQQNQGY
ncbi:RagB/SusD family nutrient uptake outer membrane protein [Subsaximicrobium wynnwilliamsii]|uniref:RagB/SusD family nutrient uptake outer membrane protein n=1 Tax=Subsaximicrobium wynnwilliamsii TaxID=291179 RepID=A0A5C6ZEQ1_9FLAO|nr:RagB/SusD family nutrient uptake outer membrane protein [Subsaximicrobium wynnwilliamsii]TXD81971.1 RagB/SusD family nutrient uptake outer membrane protein [Subsaximicrobium wynnwilliamsii]TXD87669.1 RagB/SusD family nutrient uptake outer membrane protein [Subsaximicrobium wynnwilliamsii]TXE01415.1 RagB/SusD family nutrient uptake outer membrane protein [Subsaximicrobium wynnwilliamsii]